MNSSTASPHQEKNNIDNLVLVTKITHSIRDPSSGKLYYHCEFSNSSASWITINSLKDDYLLNLIEQFELTCRTSENGTTEYPFQPSSFVIPERNRYYLSPTQLLNPPSSPLPFSVDGRMLRNGKNNQKDSPLGQKSRLLKPHLNTGSTNQLDNGLNEENDQAFAQCWICSERLDHPPFHCPKLKDQIHISQIISKLSDNTAQQPEWQTGRSAKVLEFAEKKLAVLKVFLNDFNQKIVPNRITNMDENKAVADIVQENILNCHLLEDENFDFTNYLNDSKSAPNTLSTTCLTDSPSITPIHATKRMKLSNENSKFITNSPAFITETSPIGELLEVEAKDDDLPPSSLVFEDIPTIAPNSVSITTLFADEVAEDHLWSLIPLPIQSSISTTFSEKDNVDDALMELPLCTERELEEVLESTELNIDTIVSRGEVAQMVFVPSLSPSAVQIPGTPELFAVPLLSLDQSPSKKSLPNCISDCEMDIENKIVGPFQLPPTPVPTSPFTALDMDLSSYMEEGNERMSIFSL
ncbi:hypothetical protein HK096_005006 [Nowakowskiella sp. JEL0078]|nr:hypothetical protein HK096_005006 [Nowakowskiella sp. JEL0078]